MRIDRWRKPLILSLAAAMAPAAAGCAEDQSKSALLDYSKSAHDMYERGMEEFDDEDCVEADKIFKDVRRQFPYSRYAVTAELRLADCQFIQGNYAEAAVAYGQFVKAHPTHEDAHYAAYKKGVSYVETIPDDWFINPPPYERDQGATRDARAALSRFVRAYPGSPLRERAQEMLCEVEDHLVDHEMYVAEFYLARDDHLAAVTRLEGIRHHFDNSTLVPDAMFLQAKTFLYMGRVLDARRVFGEIVEHFPEHHQSLRAKDYLDRLDREIASESAGGEGNDG